MKKANIDHVPLSASKIKTLQGCSWQYYCRYKMGLPDRGNLGSQLGSISHLIFELFGSAKHIKLYKKCLKKNNIYKVEPIRRLVKKHFANYGIKDRAAADLLNVMVLEGLKYDFFGTKLGKPSQVLSELAFDMVSKEKDKHYRIKGFIDKLFLYDEKITALIRDFKTSKKMFEGKEIDDNLQDQMYALAVSKLYPEYPKIKVEFPFLQLMPKLGSKAVLKMKKLDETELEAFEYILTEIQKQIDNFSEKDSRSNMAADKPFPSDNSFSGKLLCGFDSFKGHLKKDGEPRWGCNLKWGFDYISVKNSKGEVIKNYFMEDAYKIECDEAKGEKMYIQKYNGCPAWNRKQYSCG